MTATLVGTPDPEHTCEPACPCRSDLPPTSGFDDDYWARFMDAMERP